MPHGISDLPLEKRKKAYIYVTIWYKKKTVREIADNLGFNVPGVHAMIGSLLNWGVLDRQREYGRGKPVRVLDDDGVVGEYESMAEATRELDVSKYSVSKGIRTDKKVAGYYWEEIES